MKSLAVALVVIVLLVCDFGSDYYEFPDAVASGWDWASTLGLIYAATYFYADLTSDQWKGSS